MLKERKIFIAISVILAIELLYSLFNYSRFFITGKFQFYFGWHVVQALWPIITGLVAILIFVASNFWRSGLLRIMMCYSLVRLPMTLLMINFMRGESDIHSTSKFSPEMMIFLAANFLMTGISAYGLWKLTNRQKPVLHEITLGGEVFSEFTPAPLFRRFLNRLIDLLVILYVLAENTIGNYRYLRYFSKNFKGVEEWGLILLVAGFSLFYYLLLEGIFKTSIGKIATSTVIVNEQGGTPGFMQVVARTLCRLIPFEALSFFGKGKRGWHDTASDTYVVIGSEQPKTYLPKDQTE